MDSKLIEEEHSILKKDTYGSVYTVLDPFRSKSNS